MSTTAQHPTPNFGEPWTDLLHMLPVHEHRAIECVNACSGMADPAIEIQAMREAVKNANHFASIILAEAGKQWLATELLPDVASIEAVAQRKGSGMSANFANLQLQSAIPGRPCNRELPASAGSDVEPSNLWLHMANTHDIVLTSTEENDIKSAALDDYDAERIKWGNRIMRLEGDAAGDRARREDADKRAEVLREALIELVLVTQALGELEIPGAKDAEDVDHILCVGDCRRIAQAVAKAKTILEDSAP